MAQTNRNRSPPKMSKFGGTAVRAHSENDKVFQVLQEMFQGKVEPEVVHMILTEMDWKVDKAIDTLLTFCGEGNVEKNKNRLQRIAQEILCKDDDQSNQISHSNISPHPIEKSTSASKNNTTEKPRTTNISASGTHTSRTSNKDTSGPKVNNGRPQDVDISVPVTRTSKRPDITDHAIATNSTMSAVGIERRKLKINPTEESPLQRIRNVMASTYGTDPDSNKQGKEKDGGKTSKQKTINPLSVDDDVTTDNNLLSQSILSGALQLSEYNTQPEVSPLSPSKMYSPFHGSPMKEEQEYQDSYQIYREKFWPNMSGTMWPKSTKDDKQGIETKRKASEESTNIFPGMYTDEDNKKPSIRSLSNGLFGSLRNKDVERSNKGNAEGNVDFPKTGIGSAKTSLLERLGLAEKNEKGQLKNLQKDPAEDLDLNFNMETFDLENDDSSSDGSQLSHSGSAETMTTDLKNMLGISKGEKKEPTLIESAARELERLNALSPNAKEFVPRSTSTEATCNTGDTKSTGTAPQFLTPKCSLQAAPRNILPYAMTHPQHPQLRPMSVIPVSHIPFNPQIPVVPVSLVNIRNVPPPPPHPINVMPPTSQIGQVIPPTNMMHPSTFSPGTFSPGTMTHPPGMSASSPRPLLHPPGIGQGSSPSPPIITYHTVGTSQSICQSPFPHTSSQQMASEAQQYATVAAQNLARKLNNETKERTSSSERYGSPDLSTQKLKEKIKSGARVLIILRGLPGSGKTTLARELRGEGVIVSADDYFMNGDVYCYDQRKLTEAHEQCRWKAIEAVQNGRSPVIIDNTNTQVWEMCPYVDIAKSVNPEYDIEILEPTTPWKFKARQLAEKSEHNVPYESIKRMLDRYMNQKNVTVEMLINTKSKTRLPNKTDDIKQKEPETKSRKLPENKKETTQYIADVSDAFWEDVGSIRWKNFYSPLMNEDENDENTNSENIDDSSKIKIDETGMTGSESASSKLEVEEKQTLILEEFRFDQQDSFEETELESKVDIEHEVKVNDIDTSPDEKDTKKSGSYIPLSTGLGFQIKPQKSLSTASLQKQIELISQQKLLVSSGTSASPITVQHDLTEVTETETRTSRTPSLEIIRSQEKIFSDEIHELVNDLISEHVEDKCLSQNDFHKVQEELKAFLHIMPIDEQQRQDAECLIEHKLSIFLQSGESLELKHTVEVEENVSTVGSSVVITEKTVVQENQVLISTEQESTSSMLEEPESNTLILTEETTAEATLPENNVVVSTDKIPIQESKKLMSTATSVVEENNTLTSADGSVVQDSNTSLSTSQTVLLSNKISVSIPEKTVKESSPPEKEVQENNLNTPIGQSLEQTSSILVTTSMNKSSVSLLNSSNDDSVDEFHDAMDSTDNDITEKVSVSDSVGNVTLNSLEYSLEKAFDTADESLEINENRNEIESRDEIHVLQGQSVQNENSNLSDKYNWPAEKIEGIEVGDTKNMKEEREIWKEEITDHDSEKSGIEDLEKSVMEDLEKSGIEDHEKSGMEDLEKSGIEDLENQYWNKKLDPFNTKKNLLLGLSSESVGRDSDRYNDHSSVLEATKLKSEEVLGEHFWDVEDKPEKDGEASYWESSKTKILDRPELEEIKTSSVETTWQTSSENNDKAIHTKTETSGPSWEEPKSKRKRKKKKREKTKQDNNEDQKSTCMSGENIKLMEEDKKSFGSSDLSALCDHTSDSQNYHGQMSEFMVVHDKDSKYASSFKTVSSFNKSSVTISGKEKPSDSSSYNTDMQSSFSVEACVTQDKNILQSTNVTLAAKNIGDTLNNQPTCKPTVNNGSKKSETAGIKTDRESSLTDVLNIDKSSFIVNHFNDTKISAFNLSSLLTLKKVNVPLKKDQDVVISQLKDNNFSEKSEIKDDDKISSTSKHDIDTDIGCRSNGGSVSHNFPKMASESQEKEQSKDLHNNNDSKIKKVDRQGQYCDLQSGELISNENSISGNKDHEDQFDGVSQISKDIVDEKCKNDDQIPIILSEKTEENNLTKADDDEDMEGKCKTDDENDTESHSDQLPVIIGDSRGKDEMNSGNKKKKKTNNKRKMAAKFPEKFIDDSIKDMFMNNDWATQMPKLEGSAPLSFFPSETIEKSVSKIDGSTTISSLDLKVLSLINNGNFEILNKINYPYKLSFGHDENISEIDNDDADSIGNAGKPNVSNFDKGTMTDSLCVVGVEFLQSSFPFIPETELKDVLERCDDDVEWAVNLLLDWKYHINLTDEESDKFVDVLFKAQHIPKSPLIHRQKSAKHDISPPSLLDICLNLVTKCLDVDRQEVEQQVIASSEKRLNSLEKQLLVYTKQYSFCSFGDEVIEEDSEFTDAFYRELINSAENKSLSSQESSQVSLSELIPGGESGLDKDDGSEFWNVDLDMTGSSKQEKENDGAEVNFDLDVQDNKVGDVECYEVMQPPCVPSSANQDGIESFEEATVMLPMKKEFTKALFSLFGPVEGVDTEQEGFLIPVTLDVAKLMYLCIKTATHKGQLKLQCNKQVLEDEAYARQLQAEENELNDHFNGVPGPVSSTPEKTRPYPQPVIGVNIDQTLNLSPQRQKVVSLAKIMAEEKAKENEKRELVETLRQSGSYAALSTRLKQQKLYDQFPGIDQNVLDDIFQANCFILEDTVKAIQGSLAFNTGAPKTVMSKDAETNYERHLIEAAKQQSLQEMLDSCLHVTPVPKVIRDTQSVVVDYEEFRGEANLHYRLRHECFQKAQEAYRRGMKQVASFYSEKGHVHTKKIKDANIRASEKILATRQDMLDQNSTLDLHGLHVDEAVAALERILPNKEFELQTNPLKNRYYLIIVTGRGSHSQGGVSRLKPAVINYLRRNDYKFSEIHEGALRVSLKHRNIT